MLRAFSPTPTGLLRDAADLSVGGRDPRRSQWYYADLACRLSPNRGERFGKALRKKKSLRQYTNALYHHRGGFDSIDTEDHWAAVIGECEEDFRILDPIVTHVAKVPRSMYFPTALTAIVEPELRLVQPLPEGGSSSTTVSVQEFLVYVCRNKGEVAGFPTEEEIRKHLSATAGPYSPTSVHTYIEDVLRARDNVPHVVLTAVNGLFLQHATIVIEHLLRRVAHNIIEEVQRDTNPTYADLRLSVASYRAINFYTTDMELVLETIKPALSRKPFNQLVRLALTESTSLYLEALRPNKPINLGAVLVAPDIDYDYVVKYLHDRVWAGEYDAIHTELNRARAMVSHDILHLEQAVLDWLITQHAEVARGGGSAELAVDHLFYPSEDNAYFIRRHFWENWVRKEARLSLAAMDFFVGRYVPETVAQSGSFEDEFHKRPEKWTAYMRDSILHKFALLREAPACPYENLHAKYAADCIVSTFVKFYAESRTHMDDVRHHHMFDTEPDAKGAVSISHWLHNQFLPYTTMRDLVSMASTNRRLETLAGPEEGTRGVGAVVRITTFESDPAWRFDEPLSKEVLFAYTLVLIEADLIYSAVTVSEEDRHGVGASINRQRLAFRKTLRHALLTALPSETRGDHALVVLMARELPRGVWLSAHDTSLSWFMEDITESSADDMGHCHLVKTVEPRVNGNRYAHVIWFTPNNSQHMEEEEEEEEEEEDEEESTHPDSSPGWETLVYPQKVEEKSSKTEDEIEQEKVMEALNAMLTKNS